MIEIIPNWHPLFVHFTVALFSLSIIFFIIQRPLAETETGDNFLVFARYSLWLGAIFSVVTLIAGFDAYNTVDHDTPSHSAMTDHRNWALGTLTVFFIAAIWWAAVSSVSEKASIAFLIFLLVGGGLLVTTGHKGSLLVYQFGLGVESLPTKDDHKAGGGHDHDHGEISGGGDHHENKAESGGHSHDSADSHGSKGSSGDGHARDHNSMDSSDMDMGDLKMPPQSQAPSGDLRVGDQAMKADAPRSLNDVSVPTKTIAKSQPEVVKSIAAKPAPLSKPKSVEPKVVSKPKEVTKPKVVSKPKVGIVVELESSEDNTFLIPGAGSSSFPIPKIEKYEDGTIRETLPAVTLDLQE